MMPLVDHRIAMVHIHALLAARAQVKLDLKRQGYIVSHYKASAITELAWQLLNADRERLLAEARERIMARAAYAAAGRKYEMALARRQQALAKRQRPS
jgi:hypothetical protein